MFAFSDVDAGCVEALGSVSGRLGTCFAGCGGSAGLLCEVGFWGAGGRGRGRVRGLWGWPSGGGAGSRRHRMAPPYSALFLRRHGFDPVAGPLASSFAEDTAIILSSLADDGRGAAGGHVVAHAEGAIAAMMAAVDRPDLVFSLTLIEPACLSLTAEQPATSAHRALMQPLFDARHQLSDDDFQREFVRRRFAADLQEHATPEEKR